MTKRGIQVAPSDDHTTPLPADPQTLIDFLTGCPRRQPPEDVGLPPSTTTTPPPDCRNRGSRWRCGPRSVPSRWRTHPCSHRQRHFHRGRCRHDPGVGGGVDASPGRRCDPVRAVRRRPVVPPIDQWGYEPFPLQPLTRHSHQPSQHHAVENTPKRTRSPRRAPRDKSQRVRRQASGRSSSTWPSSTPCRSATAIAAGPTPSTAGVALGAPASWTDADTRALRAVIDQAS